LARFICGINPVLEALRARPDQIEELLLLPGDHRRLEEVEGLARAAGVKIQSGSHERLTRLSEGASHQGVVARVNDFKYAELLDLTERAREAGRVPLIVLLDGVSDPHNLGAIVRSAHALGADGVVIPQDRAASVTPVVAKASAGAIEHCPVARVVNLSRAIGELQREGLWVVAAAPDGAEAIGSADLTGPLALVLGAEGAGLRPLVRRHCDRVLRIPMEGRLGSLNASAAAAIALYEVARQRRALTGALPKE
jgi:23S rRNA (guanosine2251-2'-O)-methyltransferase